MKTANRINYALKLSAVHFSVNLLIALLIAVFVFYFLYPYPYYAVTDSVTIFLLMMVVDVCCGPLCTSIVASPVKSRREMWLDFSIIGGIQMIALIYGLVTLYAARPVYEVYEKNRFRLIQANEVQIEEFAQALPQYQALPLLGVQVLGTRKPHNANEQIESINTAIAGIEIGLRPSWWIAYDQVRSNVKQRYHNVADLTVNLNDKQRLLLHNTLDDYKLSLENTFFLPLENARHEDWIVLLNKQADIVGYAPINGYLD